MAMRAVNEFGVDSPMLVDWLLQWRHRAEFLGLAETARALKLALSEGRE